MKKRFNILKKSYLWIMISLFLGAISLFLFLFNAKYSEEFTGGVNISFVTTQNEETIQTNLENFLTNQGYTNFQTSINTQGEETQIKVNTSLESDDQVAQLSSEIQSFLLSNAVVSSTSDIIGQAIIGPSVGSYMKT
ncbi:MAG: hypothetical protein PHR46_03625, partial [Candidatus Absconditabacteria bacterium]|nr:hypothetical protein [Candidatus Absconditabacteria bacterium]